MRALAFYPAIQRGAGVIEIIEDRLVEQFVAHATVERLADALLHWLAGAMNRQANRLPWAQASMALEANSAP